MTYEEAKNDLIESGIRLGAGDFVDVEALKIAVVALEKQIPKTPNSGIDRTWGTPTKEAICPVCDCALGHWEFIGGGEKITYCEHCGQAITWEGGEWAD